MQETLRAYLWANFVNLRLNASLECLKLSSYACVVLVNVQQYARVELVILKSCKCRILKLASLMLQSVRVCKFKLDARLYC